jgi:hypothetical protein
LTSNSNGEALPVKLLPIFCQSVNGLGNDLFVAAAAMEQAKRLQTSVVMYFWAHQGLPAIAGLSLPIQYRERTFKPGWRRFKVSAARRLRAWPRSSLFVESGFSFDSRIFRIGPGTEIVGFFQSPRYFPSLAGDIKAAIRKSPRVSRIGPGDVSQASPAAIHLRLGDYLGEHEIRYHGIPSVSYYMRAAELVVRSTSAARFRVFSDSPDVACTRFERLFSWMDSQRLQYTLVGPQPTARDPLDALTLMAQAGSIVMSNSSFSWWAAFAGSPREGLAVFPRPWFASRAHDTEDLCDPDWVSLGANYGV